MNKTKNKFTVITTSFLIQLAKTIKLILNIYFSKNTNQSINSEIIETEEDSDKSNDITSKIYSLSPDYSIEQLDAIYNTIILKQSFYNSEYSQNWEITPYRAMAEMIVTVINPKSHLDIGCGIGLLVQAMRDKQVESCGLEYSESLVEQANSSIRQYIKNISIEEMILDWENHFKQKDVISLTEVCEHLPISILEKVFSLFSQNHKGAIFATIPSYGLDSTFKHGIKVNPDTPSWLRDMQENIPFKNIVLENALPHHGHITLASYRWWTEFFLYYGWSRNRDLEFSCNRNFKHTLITYNWNPYILEPIVEIDRVNESIKSGNGLNLGWYDYDDDVKGRWTDGFARIVFKNNSSIYGIKLKLSTPDINIIQDWELCLRVDSLAKDYNYKFIWNPCLISKPIEVPRKSETEVEVEILLFPFKSVDVELPSLPNCWRLNIMSSKFSPKDYDLSPNVKELGIVVHSIEILVDDRL
ncbi:methyltransferase domain-containing protein [Coleofasciculus chthonoplastes]|uniref:methyltransferase domain-containing protein n=1 Tax=Coleofasciculus chthonoplastes TaxID=64178 RepID=UPI003302F62A